MERFTRRYDGGVICDDVDGISKGFAKLADLEDAEEEGRLIELPIAVGKSFFEVSVRKDWWKNITEWKVDGYSFCNGNLYIHTEDADVYFNCKDIGKTLFKKFGEAEAKLKEREENQ